MLEDKRKICIFLALSNIVACEQNFRINLMKARWNCWCEVDETRGHSPLDPDAGMLLAGLYPDNMITDRTKLKLAQDRTDFAVRQALGMGHVPHPGDCRVA